MTLSNGNSLRVPWDSPVNSPHIGQWRGALMLSLICARINDWVNNRGLVIWYANALIMTALYWKAINDYLWDWFGGECVFDASMCFQSFIDLQLLRFSVYFTFRYHFNWNIMYFHSVNLSIISNENKCNVWCDVVQCKFSTPHLIHLAYLA